jgi:demethylmenaquinone methyltransferase / 2-methoxy-6-polyprenyl-1,4-benzoquinol methylase
MSYRSNLPAEDTHFGFKTVPFAEKQRHVNDVFHKVADQYDLMNDVMSLGIHRLWKRAMVDAICVSANNFAQGSSFHLLDVAGGTGDIAFRFLEKMPPHTCVTVFDINADMLRVGQQRAATKVCDQNRISFKEGDAQDLPFHTPEFSAYTIAFGLRNVPDIQRGLREAYRVLKRGGQFLCLEFSPTQIPMLDKLYDAYSFNLLPRLGYWIAGDAASYQYLAESIRRFPKPDTLSNWMREAGFSHIKSTPMSGGIVNLHQGWKI